MDVIEDCLVLDKEDLCYSPAAMVSEVIVSSHVVELREKYLYGHKGLRHVTFAHSSNLKRIGENAFSQASIESIVIPDSVTELCRKCFNR